MRISKDMMAGYPTFRWTVDELKDMIAFFKGADFDPAEIDRDLHNVHKRVAAAVKDGLVPDRTTQVISHVIPVYPMLSKIMS